METKIQSRGRFFSVTVRFIWSISIPERIKDSIFQRTVSEQFVEKLITGTKVTIPGTLNSDGYDKEVTKTKSVKIKREYIDVKAIEVL